jgi:hypothetical protein
MIPSVSNPGLKTVRGASLAELAPLALLAAAAISLFFLFSLWLALQQA